MTGIVLRMVQAAGQPRACAQQASGQTSGGSSVLRGREISLGRTLSTEGIYSLKEIFENQFNIVSPTFPSKTKYSPRDTGGAVTELQLLLA